MAGINKVILIGNLGKDPDMHYSPSGMAVAKFSLATTEKYKGEEKTEWHRIVAFGKLAEICGQYLNKGKQVYIDGRIQTNEWTDKEGIKRWSTDIICNNMQMLSGRGDSGGPSNFQSRPAAAPTPAPEPSGPQESGASGPAYGQGQADDDIPF